MRASVVTTLLSLVVASLPGAVRAASTERRVQIEGYPHVAAIPSRARVLVDDNGNTTSYAYDARDRGTYVVGADLTVQRSVYDADSNVVETIDRNGTTVRYTHDGDHRVVKAEVTRRATNLEGTGQGVEGTGVMAWEYDGLSRPRVCVDQNDPSDPADDVATSYTFDSLSRPLTERHRFRASTAVNAVFTQFGRISVGSAGIDKTIARTFDLDSNRTSTTYSSGRTISYGLDGADRIQQIVDGALGAGLSIQTTEWLGGRPLRSDAGNGVRTSFGYDADRRLTSLTHVGSLGAGTNVASFGYAWTRGNQRASETFTAAGLPGATQTYSYDSASRLVRVAFAGGAAPRPDTTWLIDGVGNQVKKEEDGVATALNVRANGRYLPDLMNEVATFTRFDAMASVLGEERHVQDPNGSRIKDGQFKLYFDAFERLVRVERAADGVVVGRYRYDAAGRRVDRQFRVGGGPLQQVFHVHDGAQEVEEIDGSGAVQADFLWGGLYVDQLVQMRRGGGTYYAHQNSVFSVVALTDASGAVAERYGYSSVYGVCQVQNADASSRSSASEVGNPWRFQGRRWDPETGWLYFRARFLDPAVGRWVSRDPLGIWGDAGQIGNAYSFCGNDPVNLVDPSGKGAAGFLTGLFGGATGGGAAGGVTAAGAATVGGLGVIGGAIVSGPWAYEAYQAWKGAWAAEEAAATLAAEVEVVLAAKAAQAAQAALQTTTVIAEAAYTTTTVALTAAEATTAITETLKKAVEEEVTKGHHLLVLYFKGPAPQDLMNVSSMDDVEKLLGNTGFKGARIYYSGGVTGVLADLANGALSRTMPGGLLDTEKKAVADAITDHESGKYDYNTIVMISLNKDKKDACGTCGKAMSNFVFEYEKTLYYHPGGLVLPDPVDGAYWDDVVDAGLLQLKSGKRMGYGYVHPKPCE